MGRTGQFDVLADGAVIAKKGGGLLSKILGLGGGFPDEDAVVNTLRAKRQS